MSVDTSKWSGEGLFTQVLLERLPTIHGVAFVRIEDAPASRSEADFNFISNEVFVGFEQRTRVERSRRFGILPITREVATPAMTVADLEAALSGMPDVGAPDYADDGMLQYLKTERVIPPYQTRGYKLVELVRIYQAAPSGA